ncbi:MAG: erythromycin esterase family protein [Phycisphaerae bacterium]|nr:erythromycin esterase family protein [Phycisphaerae bacterium]
MNTLAAYVLAAPLAVAVTAATIRPQPEAGAAAPGGEAAAWIRSKAVAFATSEAGNGFDDLKGLDAIVGDARIVSLGEPTHGTREAFQMKHRLLEYLVETKGFSIFSIEANMPEAYALNTYVIEGRGDPKELIGGMYFWTWNTEEVLAMVEWMRAWNERNPPGAGRPRLRFTGFDMQHPRLASRHVSEFLRAHDPEHHPRARADLDALDAYNPYSSALGYGCATGRFPVAEAAGKKIRFTGWIKTRGVDDAWAGLWWRVEGPTPFFDNMIDRGPRGTGDWKEVEIETTVPADAKAIYFGLVKPGAGAAWFDALRIEIDGVEWTNPDFDLDFEGPQPRGIIAADPSRGPPSPSYPGALDDQEARSGRSSFRLEPVTNPAALTPADAAARAKGIVDHMTGAREAYLKQADARAVDWAIQNARIVHQWTGLSSALGNSFDHRDRCMADNVEWILAQDPGEKIVLWAHNGHVGRAELWGQKWMGSGLERKFPGQMVVFGFATGHGAYTAMGGAERPGLRTDNALAPGPEGSVERVLASAGLPRMLLDIRGARADDAGSAWATRSALMRSIGALAMEQQFFPCVPKEMFDVLVWQEATTASRPLGK